MYGKLSKEAIHEVMSKTNRNDPCPCGSGLKYKKCCALADATRQQKRRTSPGLFSLGKKVSQRSPSIMQTFANRVLKVVSSPTKEPVREEEISQAAEERGYGTLEELIGVEGPPPTINPLPENEAKEN